MHTIHGVGGSEVVFTRKAEALLCCLHSQQKNDGYGRLLQMNPHSDHPHEDEHNHSVEGGHGHTHGVVDPTIYTTARGIWAIQWSFIGLFITSLFQIVVVMFTGSVALLADTIHNIGDATTAIPLWMVSASNATLPVNITTTI